MQCRDSPNGAVHGDWFVKELRSRMTADPPNIAHNLVQKNFRFKGAGAIAILKMLKVDGLLFSYSIQILVWSTHCKMTRLLCSRWLSLCNDNYSGNFLPYGVDNLPATESKFKALFCGGKNGSLLM